MISSLQKKPEEQDNFSSPFLNNIGVGYNIQRFFVSYISIDNASRLVFDYSDPDCLVADTEKIGFSTYKLACSAGIWIAGNPIIPKEIFLFFSGIEAIAFTAFSYSKYNFTDHCLLVSLGVKPSKSQILFLKSTYKNANFHTVFGNDIIGRLYDCKVSLWLSNKDCVFYLEKGFFKFTAPDDIKNQKVTVIERREFCYSSFCRAFGKRHNIGVHKPKNPLDNSFFESIKRINNYISI
ncbi:hypothetical protein [Mucilaginibacter arboris]|uniref:Uncharacterized protein n=1 Tax=Mucilaginibacter arboris TaxID=2682090 RepID=A0A7K1T0D4_9SPHI|nr:hypothetical protein [Mucilaginibacter arboris]MVN23013.1 hypothetical protein [Mucilaginibacter arboris]